MSTAKSLEGESEPVAASSQYISPPTHVFAPVSESFLFPSPFESADPNSINVFLSSLGLPQYTRIFQWNEIHDIETLIALNHPKCEKMWMKLIPSMGHIATIRRRLEDIRIRNVEAATQSSSNNSNSNTNSDTAQANVAAYGTDVTETVLASATSFRFGPHNLPVTQIFAVTPFSFASVNLKPLVPGHALILPRRGMERVSDMKAEELSDLWILAQRVGRMLSKHFNAPALSFAIQDGAEAGQTVAHVHLHIIPRKKGDFKKNDGHFSYSS